MDLVIRFSSWVWLGMVVGVSLIATPAKFRAESLELAVALDVGRATFDLFIWLQWGWLILLGLAVIFPAKNASADRRRLGALAVISAIMLAQSAWILPALNDRVATVIAGDELADSRIHLVFAVVEGAKILALGLLGLWAGRD